MRYFEVEGDSPDVVLAQFLNQRGIPREYVEYEVMDSGSKGLLGIGKRKARLKIKYDDREHAKKRARLVLSELLDKAGFEDAHVSAANDEGNILLNIDFPEPETLIGRLAQTLDAIQYLLDKMLKLDDGTDFSVIVDVAGYRKKVVEQSVRKALSLAQQVKRTGKSVKLAPMTTMIRREIHIALKDVPGVSTVSAGEGQIKQICIVPDKKAPVRKRREYAGDK